MTSLQKVWNSKHISILRIYFTLLLSTYLTVARIVGELRLLLRICYIFCFLFQRFSYFNMHQIYFDVENYGKIGKSDSLTQKTDNILTNKKVRKKEKFKGKLTKKKRNI